MVQWDKLSLVPLMYCLVPFFLFGIVIVLVSSTLAHTQNWDDRFQLLGLYADIRICGLNPSSIIHAVTTNKNRVAAHGIEQISTRDIRPTFVSIRQFFFEVLFYILITLPTDDTAPTNHECITTGGLLLWTNHQQ